MGGYLGFTYRQLAFRPKPVPRSVRLDGMTALVTGSNTGLGLEAAKELVEHGVSCLIITARSKHKGDAARKEILAQFPNCDVQLWDLDYESFDSIRVFGERAQLLPRLDIVILSAGVKHMEFVQSRTGHEAHVQVGLFRNFENRKKCTMPALTQQIQVNHLGTAALSLLLLTPLRNTAKLVGAPRRLTVVTSEVHFWTNFSEQTSPNILARLDERSSFKAGSMDRYNVSKLLNVMWLRELSSRVGAAVIINGVNPGLCASDLHRAHPGIESFNRIFAWTAKQGGHCLVDAATQHVPDQGAYISEQVVKKPSNFVQSAKGVSTQKRVCRETMDILKKALPGVYLDVM